MKKLTTLLTVVLTVALLSSCGSSKKTIASNNAANPFGTDFYELPCAMYDDDEFFAATGTAHGSRNRIDVLQQAALANAQGLCRQKIQHAYKGMVSNYMNYMGMNDDSSAAGKIEAAGDQIIQAIINDTQARCIKTSSVDEKGNVTMYVGVKISKEQLADKVADRLSKDQELKLRFDEEQFRKKMNEEFDKYKEKR